MNKRIETSICITEERRDRLVSAAVSLNVEVTDVLAALMRKSRVVLNKNIARLWRAVEYQKSSPEKEYLIWHVSLEPRCYEYGVSERLVFKVSVSLIYSMVIDLFLDTLVKNGLDAPVHWVDISTNYKKAQYNILHFEQIEHEHWIICWDRRLKNDKTT